MGVCTAACSNHPDSIEAGVDHIRCNSEIHFSNSQCALEFKDVAAASATPSCAKKAHSECAAEGSLVTTSLSESCEGASSQVEDEAEQQAIDACAFRVVEALGHSLATSADLDALFIGVSNHDDLGACWVAAALQTNISLTAISLCSNNIYGSGAKMIGAALERNTTLEHINFSKNVLGPEGAQWIGAALQKNNTLTSVELGWNYMGAVGIDHICTALLMNDTVTNIDLSGNNSRTSVQPIARVLENNNTLVSMNLQGNRMGDEGAARIGSALERNTTLCSLNLGRNQISDIGAQKLASSLKRNLSLISIDLAKNQIGDGGARDLLSILTMNLTIICMTLDDNFVSDTLLEQVETAAEKNMLGLKVITVWSAYLPEHREFQITCTNVAGEEVCRVSLAPTDSLSHLKDAIAAEIAFHGHLQLLLPDSGDSRASLLLEDAQQAMQLKSFWESSYPS